MAQRKIAIVIKIEGSSKAERDFNKVAAAEKRTQQATKAANAEFRKQQKHLQQLAIGSAKLSHAQNGLTSSFIKGNLAARAISIAVRGLQQAMAFGVREAISFEFAVAKISAITGTVGPKLNSLEKKIRKLAAVSPKTSTEVASTALAMSKLGFSATDTQASLEGVISLSVALDESTEAVGETLLNVANVYDQAASEINSTSDKLFTGFSKSALNLEKFSTAFAFAGGTAKVAGVEFEQLVALMGGLSKA
ncbi:unnamed protein product, partial [marine sediment metagenome]